MAKILITCAGSGVGQSAVDALNLRREHLIVGCDGNLNVMARSSCDHFFTVPSIYDPNYIDIIIDNAVRLNIDLIIPGHDHELALFSSQIEKFHECGLKVLVSTPELIKVSRDKQEWYNFFAPRGCNIVPTTRVDQFKESPQNDIFPAIVKPSGGSASQGITIINEFADLEGLKDEDIIQPYLFPEKTDPNYNKIKKAVANGQLIQLSEISIQFVFSHKSELSGLFISRNTLKSGVPVYVEPIDPQTFNYIEKVMQFVPIFKEYGVVGPVNIQGRITENDIYFFEMNMRFTGITGNRAQLGFNEVEFLVNDFLELPAVTLGKYAYNKVGARQVGCTTLPKEGSKREALFILGAGSNLGVSYLKENSKNYRLIYIAYRKESHTKYKELFGTNDNIVLVEHTDPSIQSYLAQSDVFINFVSALAFQKDELKFDAVRYIYNLIPKIVKAKISTVINISSQSVYDQGLEEIKSEEQPAQMGTAYAFQKTIIEDFFASIKEYLPRAEVSSLRIARIIDPQNPSSAGFFGKLVDAVKNQTPMEIAGVNNTTNLVHIKDVVNAIEFIIRKSETTSISSTYNVGGDNISMQQYCELIVKLSKKPSIFKYVAPSTKDTRTSSMINSEKINQLGYHSLFSVDSIITELSSLSQ